MREALFIKRNRDKWNRYQQEPATDPDEQAERFITLLDDLAYAKTFYPQSKATKWVNSIAVNIYQRIYQNRKERFTRLRTFWTEELPLLIRRHHRTFLFTFLSFSLFIIMGVVSSATNDEFVK
ncbi:MAG TPA: stage II sporulation protein M, partial [Phnomibacter sp.]|nr:stage II sporulation protein M [Phnomibacter sp.]